MHPDKVVRCTTVVLEHSRQPAVRGCEVERDEAVASGWVSISSPVSGSQLESHCHEKVSAILQ